ncbi:MAG: hypothetical protein GY822_31665 [Deltaproteobacteria bacterium]|nr:hypothetical protein [Deltaproteobacteria bacterium]
MHVLSHPDDVQLLCVRAGDAPHELSLEVNGHLENCSECRVRADAFSVIVDVAQEDEAVNPFQSKRMERELNRQLDSLTLAQRRHWAPPKVVAALLVAAFSGATFAMTAGGWRPFEPTPEVKASPPSAGHSSSVPVQIEKANSQKDAPVENDVLQNQAPKLENVDENTHQGRALALALAQSSVGKKQKEHSAFKRRRMETNSPLFEKKNEETQLDVNAEKNPTSNSLSAAPLRGREVAMLLGTPSAKDAAEKGRKQALQAEPSSPMWNDVGDLFSLAGQSHDAIDAYVRALAGSGSEKARSRLNSLLADEPSRSVVLLERISKHRMAKSSVEGLRLRCELGLVHNKGRSAVMACHAFAGAFPAHRAVRVLLLAAGERAVHRLHDEKLAIELFSMALSPSDFGGLPSTKAVFARAGCYERLHKIVQARTDLELFLKLEPEAVHKHEVRSMAKRLGLELAR